MPPSRCPSKICQHILVEPFGVGVVTPEGPSESEGHRSKRMKSPSSEAVNMPYRAPSGTGVGGGGSSHTEPEEVRLEPYIGMVYTFIYQDPPRGVQWTTPHYL